MGTVFKVEESFALKGFAGGVRTSHDVEAGELLVTLPHQSVGVVRDVEFGLGASTMLVNMGPKDVQQHVGAELTELGPGSWVVDELRIKLDGE